MRFIVRSAFLFAALACAAPAFAQFEATKFPVRGVIFDPTMGQYVADPGATVRWRVVLNSLLPPPFGQDVELDFADIVGGDSCGAFGMPGLDCMSSGMLTLLCPADMADPDYPDGAGFTVGCDAGTGRFTVDRVLVPAGGKVCLEFSTVVDPMAAGLVGNAGCMNVLTPAPQVVPTSPPDPNAGTWPWDCTQTPTAAAMPNCTTLFIFELPDFEFELLKTAAHDDADGNGFIDPGEQITWTVTMTDLSTDMMDVTGYMFDDIEIDQDFGAVITDPGNCAFDVGRRQVLCDPLVFTDGEVKVLEFTTTVNCDALTAADDNRICNQARLCGDDTGISCAPSDDDGVFSGIPDPTCLDFAQVDFSSSEKTWSWVDVDGDGSLSTGDTVDYSITVTNTGSRDATDLEIVDDLNPNLDPATGCMQERTLVVNDGGTFDPGTGVITWTLRGPLAPGGSATVGFSVAVTENAPCCNSATVNSAERTGACPAAPGIPTDDPSQPGDADETCLVFGPQPSLTVEKDFTEEVADGQVMVGEQVTFTVTIRNDGGAPATAVSMTDPVLGCFSACSPVTITGEGTDNSTGPGMGTACTVNVSDIGGVDGLLPGEEVLVSWTVTVDSVAGCCNVASVSYAESSEAVGSVDPVTGAGRTCVDRGESDCANMLDDDGDGLVDCADPDCAMDPACMGVEDCTNGVDDDGDGAVDCAPGREDADCPCGPESTADMNCGDGVDNDGDGLTDDLDPDCAVPEDCTNGVDDDGDGAVDCVPGMEDADCPCGPESIADMNCGDGVDNDGDGLTDRDDPDCMLVEDCTNGVDDDGDGAVDCLTGREDPDCPCGPESLGDMNCGDGVDNDGDGLTDMDDPDCVAEDCTNGVDDDGDGLIDCVMGMEDPDCPCGPESPGDMNCGDGVDNDGDGLVDAADPDCAGVEDCGNGLDDDGDGDVDCLDSDCVAAPGCAAEDFDGDGVDNATDCAPLDPFTWAPPVDVSGLTFGLDPAGGGGVLLTWDCQSAEAGPATVYDVVWGLLDDLIATGDTMAANCADDAVPPGNDVVDSSPDCRPSFLDLPRSGNLYYMVRGQNSCGTGSYGSDSAGRERTVGAGDCP